jgi:hypothetical protein
MFGKRIPLRITRSLLGPNHPGKDASSEMVGQINPS